MPKYYILGIACALTLAVPKVAFAERFYEDNGLAVVQLHVTGTLKKPDKSGTVDLDNYGTGFLVSSDGMVLTAGHMVPTAADLVGGRYLLSARLPQRSEIAVVAGDPWLPADVLNVKHPPVDVALLKIHAARPLPYLPLCGSYTVEDTVVVLGYPIGDVVLTRGPGAIASPAIGVRPLIITAPINPGDSGDPVFDTSGGVIAVAVNGTSAIDGQRYEARNEAVTIDVAIRELAPQSNALVGASYAHDCQQVLRRSLPVQRGGEVRENSFVLAGMSAENREISFNAPHGYILSDAEITNIPVTDTGFTTAVSNLVFSPDATTVRSVVSAQINPPPPPDEGLFGYVTNLFRRSSSPETLASVETRLDTEYVPVVSPIKSKDDAVRSVSLLPIARAIPTSACSSQPQPFVDYVRAPEAAAVARIRRTQIVRQRGLVKGPYAAIAPDGKTVSVSYALACSTSDKQGAFLAVLLSADLQSIYREH